MPLILRADVDKPYGRAQICQKIISKLRENFYFPALTWLDYGRPAEKLADYLHHHGVIGYFSFRLCTLPTDRQLQKFIEQGHRIGLHAEDTRSEKSFLSEVAEFKRRLGLEKLDFFTKHGSGQIKLGRRHHPPYEEEKYRAWSKKHGIAFPFGNGQELSEDTEHDSFHKNMFWINRGYRDNDKHSVSWAIDKAAESTLVVIIHPENYLADPTVKKDLDQLVSLARKEKIDWTTII